MKRLPTPSVSVCFVSPTAYGYFESESETAGGGAERQLYLLSQRLKSELDVSFVVGDYGQKAVTSKDGISLYRAYEPSPDRQVVSKTLKLYKLLRAMRRANADVYVYRGRPMMAIVVALLTRLLRSSFVYNVAVDEHVEPQNEPPSMRLRLFRLVISRAEGVVAQTEYQRRCIRETVGREVTVITNGYEPMEAKSSYSNREFFLWVGRLDRSQKRPHLYLDLAESLPDQEFVMIGPADTDPDYANRIKSRAEGIDNLQYLGRVPPDEIHSYYLRAIALVNTSEYEGYPNTFLEAWRCGTPVVSLSVPLSRYLPESVTFGYANGDKKRIREICVELASNENRWQQVSNSVRGYFERNLTISSAAKEYYRLIQDIATSESVVKKDE